MSIENQQRLLDRSQYPKRTISTYGVIGAYIVDIYYNHLYAEAIKCKNDGRVASITEGYKHMVFAFLSAIDYKTKRYDPKHYAKLLTGINEYFTKWTSFDTLTMGDCIDKIVREFVPEDYYTSLDKDQKRNILRVVLTNSIKEFTICVIKEYLGGIIDNHDEMVNIEVLKEKMTDLLILEREAFYQKFIDTAAGKKPTSNDGVSRDMAQKMQLEIKKLIGEKKVFEKQAVEFKKIAEIKQTQLEKLLEKYQELLRRYKFIKEDFAAYKERQASVPKEPIMFQSNPDIDQQSVDDNDEYDNNQSNGGQSNHNASRTIMLSMQDAKRDVQRGMQSSAVQKSRNITGGNQTNQTNQTKRNTRSNQAKQNTPPINRGSTNQMNKKELESKFLPSAPPLNELHGGELYGGELHNSEPQPTNEEMDNLINKHTKPGAKINQTVQDNYDDHDDHEEHEDHDDQEEHAEHTGQEEHAEHTGQEEQKIQKAEDKIAAVKNIIRKSELGKEPSIGDMF